MSRDSTSYEFVKSKSNSGNAEMKSMIMNGTSSNSSKAVIRSSRGLVSSVITSTHSVLGGKCSSWVVRIEVYGQVASVGRWATGIYLLGT